MGENLIREEGVKWISGDTSRPLAFARLGYHKKISLFQNPRRKGLDEDGKKVEKSKIKRYEKPGVTINYQVALYEESYENKAFRLRKATLSEPALPKERRKDLKFF